tara:strand:+ start:1189 stop:1632 length:444 start_codon:yes stop_codon:yes gene_type:complete
LPKDIDAELVRKLAGLLDETGLGEIEYSIDNWKIRVVKHTSISIPASQNIAGVSENRPTNNTNEPQSTEGPEVLKSPMVGTAYLTPDPDSPPFVIVGSDVNEGETVLIIEAMKVMNPIPAHRSGKVKEILVQGGDPLEFGQPIMVIE